MRPALLVHEFEWHGRCDSTSLWRLISAPDDVFGCIGTALGSHTIWVIMRSVAPCPSEGIWCIYFLQSVALFNRSELYSCRLYGRIGHNLHDKEVHSRRVENMSSRMGWTMQKWVSLRHA